ncbi:hypothetical protein GE061_005932 [Apolygus lucorum]|uniref:NADH dehydrogenase [ubiquinone] 1 alpha subcomplex assembly factor 2 n=1 Tax=Apolygus lucorum TaxID=248454 RepID=A0A8S9WTT8_APOLU|nr:hypothetical protein GE061_005932 [Apolygus lucorum]
MAGLVGVLSYDNAGIEWVNIYNMGGQICGELAGNSYLRAMSRGRGLIASVLQNFFNSLKPRQVSGKLIGKDYLGNSYYEVKPPVHSSRSRPSRYYIPKDNDATKFDEPLPAEWEAWLRLRRRDPPSTEEVAQNFQLMSSKKIKALEIDKRHKGTEEDDQVVTGIKNFPSYGEYEKYPGKGPGG